MAGGKKRWQWLGNFLGISRNGCRKALEILRARYIEERRQVIQFTQHAQKMQYPQFRARLLQIASEEADHADRIAEEIRLLGGKLPDVPGVDITEKNSWQYLLADLEEEGRCADELLEQILTIQPELPGVAQLLERIQSDEKKHREAIRDMLMKSDPQALWPA